MKIIIFIILGLIIVGAGILSVYFKRHPKVFSILAGGFLLLLLAGGIFIFVIAKTPYSPHLQSYLEDPSVLKSSQQIYQYSEPNVDMLAPGNDSTLYSISKLSPASLTKLRQQTVVFKDCHKQASQKRYSCSTSPTWRPRAAFVDPAGTNYQTANIQNRPSLVALYKSIIAQSDTICASEGIYDVYDGAPKDETPNGYLICIDPSQRLVSFEYLADGDSKNL